MNSQKPFYRMLEEICKEKNIEQKMLSYGWIRELKKDNKTHHIMRYQFDLNTANSYNIAGDKFATYEVLKSNNVPTIEHKMIFNPETRKGYFEDKFIKETKELLAKNNNKLVIKANDSCKGKDVYFCSTEEQVEQIVKKLFSENKDTLSACPYLDIDYEYRAIYLDGEILFIYKKRKAYVVGDGKSTVKELIEAKENTEVEITICKKVDLNYVPKVGEEVTISWKHNLSSGAEPILIDENEENLDKIKDIAIRAGKAINIRFASVDIALTSKKEILVMEINGSVCMNRFSEVIPNGYEIAKNIYSKAIDKMMNE